MMAQKKVIQKMRSLEIFLILVAVTLFNISPAWADSPPPVTTLSVYFERDTIPVNQTVTFTVNCSAFDNLRENQPNQINKLGDLFSYSAICPSYGCFSHMYQYMPYANLTSCDFIGEVNGEQFAIMNAQHPFSCTISQNWKTQTCDLRVNISLANFTAIKTQATNITPAPTNRVVIMETPTMQPAGNMGIFDDFICFLKNLLGGTC